MLKAAGDGESMEDIEAENPGMAAAGDGDLKFLENNEAENPGTAATGLGNIEDIFTAAVVGDLESLKNIEAKSPGTVASARDWERCTALHLAAGEGHTEVCGYLITKLKVFVDTRDMNGETPLFKATKQAHVETVRFLLLNSASHNAKTRMGVTPLHKAASIGNHELVELLIAKDKKLKSQSNMGIPLAFAVESGSIECFKALIEAGAAPEVITLHDAVAKSGNVEIVEWFLKAGRDPDAHNSEGLKPIEVAAHYNNLDLVKLLFPRTTPFLDDLNWSVEGVMKNELLKNERKGMDHVSEEEAARSHFGQVDRDALSDQEIHQKLAEMLLKDEYNFFHGWSPMKKDYFMNRFSSTPPA